MNKAFSLFIILGICSIFLHGQIHCNHERYTSDTSYYDTPFGKAYFVINLVVFADSVIHESYFNTEHYTYRFRIDNHDPNLKCVDTTVSCSYPVSFHTLNNELLLSTDTFDVNNRVNLHSLRNDTDLIVCKKPDLQFGFGNSRILVCYISKEHSYSSVVIESEGSLFFLRIEYDDGIVAMVLNATCIFGQTRLRRVCQ